MEVPGINVDISLRCAARLTTVIHREFVIVMINVRLGVLMAVSCNVNFLGYGTSTLKMELLGSSRALAPM